MEQSEITGVPLPQQGGGAGAANRPANPLADPTLAPFLEKSPTLQAGIAQARRDGLAVEWGPAGEGTYLVPNRKIVMDESAIGQGARIARSLSHEIGHHQFRESSDLTSKQAYVQGMLRGEAAATLSNVQVRRQIVAVEGPDIGVSGTGNRPQQGSFAGRTGVFEIGVAAAGRPQALQGADTSAMHLRSISLITRGWVEAAEVWRTMMDCSHAGRGSTRSPIRVMRYRAWASSVQSFGNRPYLASCR